MREKNDEEKSGVKRDNWSADKIADESANKPSDEIVRETLRAGEEGENADDLDIVGANKRIDTPQGREENNRKK